MCYSYPVPPLTSHTQKYIDDRDGSETWAVWGVSSRVEVKVPLSRPRPQRPEPPTSVEQGLLVVGLGEGGRVERDDAESVAPEKGEEGRRPLRSSRGEALGLGEECLFHPHPRRTRHGRAPDRDFGTVSLARPVTGRGGETASRTLSFRRYRRRQRGEETDDDRWTRVGRRRSRVGRRGGLGLTRYSRGKERGRTDRPTHVTETRMGGPREEGLRGRGGSLSPDRTLTETHVEKRTDLRIKSGPKVFFGSELLPETGEPGSSGPGVNP